MNKRSQATKMLAMEWSSEIIRFICLMFGLPKNLDLIGIELESEPDTTYIMLPEKPSCNFVRMVRSDSASPKFEIGWGYNPDKFKTRATLYVYVDPSSHYAKISGENLCVPPRFCHLFSADPGVTYISYNDARCLHGVNVKMIMNLRTDRML